MAAVTRSEGSQHLRSPEFSNLEIRGTWNGDQSEPVDLRVSLEVRCVPNTQLQLLNTRSADISLIKTFSVRLQSNEWGQGNQSSGSSPQSPLFAFSAPVSDDSDKDTTILSENTSKEPGVADKGSLSGTEPKMVPAPDRSTIDLPKSRDVDPSSQVSFAPPNFSSGLRLNVAKCADWIKLQNLGKRSASDACLTDSGSDSEKDKKPNRKYELEGTTTGVNDVISVPDSNKSTVSFAKGRDGDVESISPSPTHACRGKHSRKPSLIPKPITRLEKDVANKTPSGDNLVEVNDMQYFEEDAPTPTKAVMVDRTCACREDHSVAATSIIETQSASSEGETVSTEVASSDQESSQSSLGLSRMLDGLLISLDSDEGSIVDIDKDVRPKSLSLGQPSRMAMPQTPISKPEDMEKALMHNHNHLPAYRCEDCQFSMSEPKLELDEGVLLIKNPSDVRPATYKFAITLSVFLEKGKSKGWSDLIVPGLPRMRPGESGYFLFLIPENQGLEFRTTNLQRYKIVENCFFAEFINLGDLVVPLRVCDRNFYGIVKDFTVDQEIRADHVISTMAEDEDEYTQSKLLVKYTALCSLRLHNRCFWAEKCCFFLRLDGGPEGRFRCRLEPQKTDLQIIHLQTENNPTGASHIQVICSPRDLEMFGVTWEVNLAGKQAAMNWLPRIYPVSSSSCEQNRNHLRHTFTELETKSLIEAEPQFVGFVEPQNKDDNNPTYAEHKGETSETKAKPPGQLARSPSQPPVLRSSKLTVAHVCMAFWKLTLIMTLVVFALWGIYILGNTGKATGRSSYLAVEAGDTIISGHIRASEESESSSLNVEIVVALDEQTLVSMGEPTVENETQEMAEDNPEDIIVKSDVGLDSESKLSSVTSIHSFRDKVDYWLGWKGPIRDTL